MVVFLRLMMFRKGKLLMIACKKDNPDDITRFAARLA